MQLKAAVDSSVLLAVGKLGYLKHFNELVDKLIVAQSVFEEISGDEVATQVAKLSDAGLVEVTKCSNIQLFNALSSGLGKGEAETIVLALESEADAALLDDLKARKTAKRLNVKVMGTLALLRAMLDLNLVKETPECIYQQLVAQGFWVDMELCLKILKAK